MGRTKVKQNVLRRVVYTPERFEIFREMRKLALEVAGVLPEDAIIFGSIARGDVRKDSDIEFLVFDYSVELENLIDARFGIMAKNISMATPNALIKGKITTMNGVEITFPLVKMKRHDFEFYKFGGSIGVHELRYRSDLRVPGVNKQLLLIQPCADGHEEMSILGIENAVASMLGISVETVMERVLMRRDAVGRTGVYLNMVLEREDAFGTALMSMAHRDPVVRRVLEERGSVL
jgi:predicted nucleotidyltransferase